jgi:glucose/arabinose dehydrogenase
VSDNGTGYTIPADNPYPDSPVWSWGLRNPWRFSFDRSTGDLYIGDVGEATWEEINVATAISGRGRNVNYGWAMYEGTHCYEGPCSPGGKTMPVLEYVHDYNSNINNAYSVIGGYVYRGSAIAGLQGHYFYGDVGGTWLRSFKYASGAATEQTLWDVRTSDPPLSFAQDHQGELYILTQGGEIFRIAP